MNGQRMFAVYCDESCHLEHDGSPVMAWGAITCSVTESARIVDAIRALKAAHGLPRLFEVKWTKVSPAKGAFYLALVRLFLEEPHLRFRGVVVPDKALLDHRRFNQSHDDWYYKMYFTMLRPIFCAPHGYRIYLDIKDTRGGPRMRKLQEVLARTLNDVNGRTIQRVQQIHSKESELLQLADLLTGALTYANRSLKTNSAKLAIIDTLRGTLGQYALSRTSPFAEAKFNILVWQAQESGG
jgi:hypothetical protein